MRLLSQEDFLAVSLDRVYVGHAFCLVVSGGNAVFPVDRQPLAGNPACFLADGGDDYADNSDDRFALRRYPSERQFSFF